MTHSLEKDVAPLVDHFHGLASQAKLSRGHPKILQHMFQSIQTPASNVHVGHYTPDSTNSEENTLGNSGTNPFPTKVLVSRIRDHRHSEECVQGANSVPCHRCCAFQPQQQLAPHGNFPPNVALITLTKYRDVFIDKEKKRATVKAGTNLDVDPEESDSTEANSLVRQLQAAGFALPETGGITHQTVGGFLSTGE